jgi:hypothetical protein
MAEDNDNDNAAADEGVEGAQSEPTPEAAEEIMKDPKRFIARIRQRPELLDNLAAGYQMAKEGFSEILTANDRGAGRVKDTADKVIETIREDLARGGLTPDERYRLVEAEERVLGRVEGSEKDFAQANERSFAKMAAVAGSVAVGAVVLGYLAKEGKLPPLNPPTV